MQVIIDSTAKCVSEAAERFSALLRRKPDAVLGLATGSTPEALYGQLIAQYEAGFISFKQVTTFNLDEYVGLDGNHPQSYDLLLLGIGTNGHIGFNEPGCSFDALTHITDLEESTRQANARFFASPEEVPMQAVTMGIHTIMQARRIILMAFGANKAQAIEGAVIGPVTADLPASILRLHPDVTIFADDDAAAGIKA